MAVAGAQLPENTILRASVLDSVEAWLSEQGEPVFLVTGSPGCGKTTLVRELAHLHGGGLAEPGRYPGIRVVLLARPYFCAMSGAEASLDPIDFVKALSESLAELVPGFADALVREIAEPGMTISNRADVTVGSVASGGRVTGISVTIERGMPARRAFGLLVRRPLRQVAAPGTVLVAVDDLSAAYTYDPEDNIAALLGTVAQGPGSGLPPWLRFLCTSRPDPIALRLLPEAAVQLDRTADTDLRDYLRLRLADVAHRQSWIDHLSRLGGRNFLYAYHIVNDLLRDPAVFARHPETVPLPRTLAGLYRQWMHSGLRKNEREWRRRFKPILGALAVARGTGLTLDELSGVTGLPGDQVAEILDDCAQYLRGDGDHGPVQLYHDTFREYLTEDRQLSIADAHRGVIEYFRAACGGDWLKSAPYARAYAAEHGAAVGLLGELMSDASFLVAAEPAGLLHALPGSDAHDLAEAETYRRALAMYAGDDPAERAAYLEYAAMLCSAQPVLARVLALGLAQPWWPLLGYMLRTRPRRLVAQPPGGVVGMATFKVAGRAVVATASYHGELHLWDLRSGTPLSGPIALGFRAVHVAAGGAEEDPVLLVSDGTRLAAVDPASAEPVGEFAADGGSMITALAADTSRVALGRGDGRVELYDLVSRTRIEVRAAHSGPVLSLALAEELLLSGGADGRLRPWQWTGQSLEPAGTARSTWRRIRKA
ncbi:hypothetical protein ACFWY5_55755 [Nonomuraea sp. NPDC059007]|uniref:hypothetical protein n=1 Tax=Nonomuraea sp. NPDC059007 TaxID=3346692 RepID=UPI00367E2FCC